MGKTTREDRLESKMETTQDLPVFSEAQVETFNSNKVASLDDALSVLDETNRLTIGQTKSFSGNKKGGS